MRHALNFRHAAVVVGVTLAGIVQAGDVVAVMAPGAKALTKDQVANVYIGRSKDLKPLDLPPSSAEREAFYKKATARDASQIKALWARIQFTGLGQPPKELPDEAAIKKAVTADPKAIGYIDKSSVDSSVTVVLELN
jgi:ABC-type phosphate transport system substrate-binding protein